MTARFTRSPAISADVQTAHGFRPRQSAGLFVGVSRFDDELFAPVPFAVDDAVDLAHLFAFELQLITPAKIVLGLAGDPRKPESVDRLGALKEGGAEVTSARQTEVYARLDAQRRAAGEDGLLVAALATHGFSDQGGDFLVAEDSLRRRIERTGVAVAELFDDVSRSRCPRRLVLLDACRERLSSDTRASGESKAAMSRSFAAAITGASGQAVLAGTTLGGYAYDDPVRRNGVFTGALLDGLRGRAGVDDRGFITVRTLADFADHHVVAWVRDHRPDHAAVSQGIARRIEGPASKLPLAVDPARRQAEEAWCARRDAALGRLRENIGETLTGAFYDEIATTLSGSDSRPDFEALIREIEALDGEPRSQRSLAYYFQQHFSSPLALGDAQPVVTPLIPSPDRTSAVQVAVASLDEGTARSVRDIQPWRRLFPVVSTLLALGVIAWFGLRSLSQGEPPMARSSSDSDVSLPAQTKEPRPGSMLEGPIGMKFRYVPAGRFQMGSPETEAGRFRSEKLHEVELTRGFWIGETEVTRGQYQRVIGKNPSSDKSCGENCPVTDVSWFDAIHFLNELSTRDDAVEPCYRVNGEQVEWMEGCTGYRLATEAEWDMSAREGAAATYAGTNNPAEVCRYGNVADLSFKAMNPRRTAFECDDRFAALAPVGSFDPNGFKLRDMTGNVSEWVWDWYSVDEQEAVDPRGPTSGLDRVFRGGSFGDNPQNARLACRNGGGPSIRYSVVGFRVARSLP